MKVIDTPAPMTSIKRGRGRQNKYPFGLLKPGKTLIIDLYEYEDIGRIKSAFYQYRRNHRLDWDCSTRVVNKEIYIIRHD